MCSAISRLPVYDTACLPSIFHLHEFNQHLVRTAAVFRIRSNDLQRGEIYISLYHRGMEMRSFLHNSQSRLETSTRKLHIILLVISSTIGVIVVGLYVTLFVLEGFSNCTVQLNTVYYDTYITFATAMYLVAIPILVAFWIYG